MSYDNTSIYITNDTDIPHKLYVDNKANTTLTAANTYTNQ